MRGNNVNWPRPRGKAVPVSIGGLKYVGRVKIQRGGMKTCHAGPSPGGKGKKKHHNQKVTEK